MFKNTKPESILDVVYVADLVDILEIMGFVVYVLGNWRIKECFLGLEKQVGDMKGGSYGSYRCCC